MKENIAVMQEFLTRGQLRLCRGMDVYLIMHLFEDGRAQVYKNPETEHHYTQITMTEEEIASLAHLCFPPKESEA